ncbi:MAG: hypothetical protein Q9172_002278 [Xanthocarpia lactea]
MLPTFRSSGGEDVVAPSAPSPMLNGARFARDRRVLYDSLDKISIPTQLLEFGPKKLSDDASLGQYPELGSVPDLDVSTWSAQRPELAGQLCEMECLMSLGQYELESSPVDQRSELQGEYRYTGQPSEMCKAAELPSKEVGRHQLREVSGSTPSYTQTQNVGVPYKYSSVFTGDPMQASFGAVAQPPPPYHNGVARSRPPFQPSGPVPSGFTHSPYECPNNMLLSDNAPTQQSTHFDSFSCQEFPKAPFAPLPTQLDYFQKPAKTEAECLERQSSQKAAVWNNYTQSDLSAVYSRTSKDIVPPCSDRASLPTIGRNNPSMFMPHPRGRPHRTLGSEDSVWSYGFSGSNETPNQAFYPAYSSSGGACPGDTRQQEHSPISPPATSVNNISPSWSILSPLSSPGADGVDLGYSDQRTIPLVTFQNATTSSSSSKNIQNASTSNPNSQQQLKSWQNQPQTHEQLAVGQKPDRKIPDGHMRETAVGKEDVKSFGKDSDKCVGKGK